MDIKDIKKQKEMIEKRIFNMVKKFNKDHGIVITGIEFWALEDDATVLKNVTLIAEVKNDVDRNLIKLKIDGGDE